MKLSDCIQSPEQLQTLLGWSPPSAGEVVTVYPLRLTPLVQAQIRQEKGRGPISQMYLPSAEELVDTLGLVDPLGEEDNSPVPNLVHRYPDRVLLLLTNECAVYCRFCTRKRRVGHPMEAPRGWLDTALQYIRTHPEVRDVLLSGGDPLVLSDSKLESILESVHAVEHVEIVRVGTRIPIVAPERVTEGLVTALHRWQPTFFMLHVNHPAELVPEVRGALLRLADAGIPMLAQTVLLRGINDRVDILRSLFHQLLTLRVLPYHLMQGDLTNGTDHFRTTVRAALRLLGQLQGHTTGFAVPSLVLDLPGGGGKVTLSPDIIVDYQNGHLMARNFQGKTFHYPDPQSSRHLNPPPAAGMPSSCVPQPVPATGWPLG